MRERYTVAQVDGADAYIASDLATLHRLCFGDTAPTLDSDEGFWWIAYTADKWPAGFAALFPSEYAPRAGYLARAGVLEAHRGHGLQTRLIRVREAKARRLGWTLLHTDTTGNLHSSNNLIRAGFKMFEPAVPWAFDDSLYWAKSLDGKRAAQ